MSSQIEFTSEQTAALDTREVSIALDAGAGCGKTFVLTERFLSHLDPAREAELPSLEEVIAITFTDAAAREMRDRIRKKCRERMSNSSPEEATYWRRLLRSLDSARVMTIHSFCSSLIRQNAVELGIDPAFHVIDGPSAHIMRSIAVDDAIRQALRRPGEAIDQQVVEVAAELGLTRLRKAVQTLSQSAHKSKFHEWSKRSSSECVKRWVAFYQTVVTPRSAKKFLGLSEIDDLLDLMNRSEPQTAGLAERFEQLRETINEVRESHAPHQALRRLTPLLKSRHPDKKHVWTNKDWPLVEDKEAFTATCQSLNDVLKKNKHPGTEDHLHRVAELGLLAHRIAVASDRLYRERKMSSATLDQDDLLIEARRLLTAPEFNAAQRRMNESIRALLVDEFQDTDNLQYEIVRALVGDDGQTDHLTTNQLFFVGDEKQSIYRFRGAEPEVFRSLRKRIPAEGRLPLSKNFRSQPAVIDFVNVLFAPLFGKGYLPLRAARKQTSSRLSVEFLYSPPPTNTTEKNRVPVDILRKKEARVVAARLRELLDSGEVTVGEAAEARAACPGDVAILFRAHADMLHYEEALREVGFDYYITGGLAFYAQQEIYDVVNLLRTIDSSCDELSLLGVLRSPFFGLLDETLYWLSRSGGLSNGLLQNETPKHISAEQRAAVDRAREIIQHLRKLKSQVPVAELLQIAIERTNYDASLLAEYLGERKLANLEKLIERSRQNDAAGRDLHEQLRQLIECINNPPKEAPAATSTEETDAVRLMTVHHSKGLEFPIVVVPNINRESRSESQIAAYHPELGPVVRLSGDKYKGQATGIDFYLSVENEQKELELDRLFYVACTRAADHLILSSCAEDLEKPKGHWLELLAERFDLHTGALHEATSDMTPLLSICDVSRLALRGQKSNEKERRMSLVKIVEAAELIVQKDRTPLPIQAAPIARDQESPVWFSVSRLTGKLHRSRQLADADQPVSSQWRSIDPRELGTLTHAVLERLDPQAGSFEEQIERWTSSLAPLHITREIDQAAQEADTLVRNFVLSDRWQTMIASRDLRREVEFLLAWPPDAISPGPTIHGYIDALYQDASGAWRLVDYKTNRVDAAGVPLEAEQYRLQMSLYALAIERALGVTLSSMTLCFLRPNVEYDFPWNEEARGAAIELVNRAIHEVRSEQANRSA